MFKYKYDPEHLHYMKEQIWECKDDLSVYDRLSEFEHNQYAFYLPLAPSHVMDLGCGLGRAGIYLSEFYNQEDDFTSYIMADSSGDTANHGAWGLDEVYNRMDLTYSFCRLNGIRPDCLMTFDTKYDNWDAIPKLDLIISHCSFGMHFPIEDIMPNLLKCTNKHCTMIFGTRKRDIYSDKSFTDLFEKVYFLPQDKVDPFPQQDWLILKNKK